MIVGNGDIASVLPEREDLLFFASGVSNSLETRYEEFSREKKLLFDQDYNQHIVYFSTLSIFYKNSPYTDHKKRMEMYVRMFKHWTILRLGNITWGNNHHTIINNFRNKIKSGEQLIIKDTYRYIVDKDEFLYWISMIPEWNCEMSITGRRMKIVDIVKDIKEGKL
jgi:hypothetical protein